MEPWNLQRHLEAMEGNIREDIKSVMAVALAAQATANHNEPEVATLKQRVSAIEKNLNWIFSGLFTGIMALAAFVWKTLTKP